MNHYHYAWFLVLFGRWDEAVAEHRRAQQLDPLTPLHTVWIPGIYLHAGQVERALEEARQNAGRYPDNAIAFYLLGESAARLGRYDEAIAAHERMVSINPRWSHRLARTYTLAGRRSDALAILRALEAERPTPWLALGLARFYATLGDREQALHWLMYQPPHAWVGWAPTWPEFDILKGDPRYDAFLRRMNLHLAPGRSVPEPLPFVPPDLPSPTGS